MLVVKDKIGVLESTTSGADSLEQCLDKDHFLNYPKHISYTFNSKGFRDNEWPEDLSDVIWCVGDSFTVGIGQPFKESWPQMLNSKLGKRCINIGEDGCSNDMIQLRVNEIIRNYNPGLIVVMWSYMHRRLLNSENVHSNKNDFGADKDVENFCKNYNLCDNKRTNIIHSIIPGSGPKSDPCKVDKVLEYRLKKQHKIKDLILFPQLDYARDYHHFDIKTSELVTDLMIEKIKSIDNKSGY